MQVFFKNFASKNQLPGLSVNGTLIKNGLKNDFSGEITHFQKGLFFKQHPWRRRLSNLFSILSIIVSMTTICEITSLKVFENKLGKMFFLILYFWTRRPNSFHNVIFNQWGQLLPGWIKGFFCRSIVTP